MPKLAVKRSDVAGVREGVVGDGGMPGFRKGQAGERTSPACSLNFLLKQTS
jgi:hypothetical protein